MELLLNLAWLLLALPAYWLWCGSRTSHPARKLTSRQCLLALACLLAVLFPVVSATDDLRAMRTEMEESPVSKRTIRQASNEKASGWNWQSQPALAGSSSFLIEGEQGWHPLPTLSLFMPAAPAVGRAARAPPVSFLV
jgi:hypothetical protein